MSSPAPSTPATTTPFYNNPGSMNTASFNPTMAVIIIVLVGGCFVLGFISVIVRKCMTGQSAGAVTNTVRSQSWKAKARGLDKEAVEALPIVHSCDLEEDDDRECPVCLTEFEPEDNLRLLPTCKHVFHQECIDAWFDAHSTCPLCRASLAGAVNTESVEPGASREPAVATVNEDSEHGDSDIEVQPTTTAAAPREDLNQTAALTAVGAPISREDSINSARGTLSRNSQSFKRAARGVTALEKAHSSGAQLSRPPITPTGSSRKPPLTSSSSTTGIRRSTSLGTDLIALRKLLLAGDQNGNPNSTAANRLKGLAKPDAPSTSSSWFAREKSMDLSRRGRSLPRDNWSPIDLESGKAVSISQGESSTAPERTRSDRWSLTSLRSALGRSSSDAITQSNNSHFPV